MPIDAFYLHRLWHDQVQLLNNLEHQMPFYIIMSGFIGVNVMCSVQAAFSKKRLPLSPFSPSGSYPSWRNRWLHSSKLLICFTSSKISIIGLAAIPMTDVLPIWWPYTQLSPTIFSACHAHLEIVLASSIGIQSLPPFEASNVPSLLTSDCFPPANGPSV